MHRRVTIGVSFVVWRFGCGERRVWSLTGRWQSLDADGASRSAWSWTHGEQTVAGGRRHGSQAEANIASGAGDWWRSAGILETLFIVAWETRATGRAQDLTTVTTRTDGGRVWGRDDVGRVEVLLRVLGAGVVEFVPVGIFRVLFGVFLVELNDIQDRFGILPLLLLGNAGRREPVLPFLG